MGMELIEQYIITLNEWIWGWPLITLLLGAGAYFTVKLKTLTLANLKLGIRYVFEKENHSHSGDISSFAALCTALSATLGTGNIVGVAVSITVGGPGVIFWLWVSSLLCLSIKYAEGVLAIKYRITNQYKQIIGGPMRYIEVGLKSRLPAKMYALFGVFVAILGIGTLAQSNSIVAAAGTFGMSSTIAITLLSAIVVAVTIGGLKRISQVAQQIVPIMTVIYIGAAILILLLKIDQIPQAFYLIFQGACSPQAILGCGAGVTVANVVHIGISRGIYAHESGLGSSAIAVATAKTDSSVKQGLISMVGALLSVVVCTMTGLVLLITNADTGFFSVTRSIDGNLLTSCAFVAGLGMGEFGKYIVSLSIIFFAFTTIIGWNFYGEKCIQYLLNDKYVIPYKIVFVCCLISGAFLKIDTVFVIADIVIGLMIIPNVLGIIGLRKELTKESLIS